MRQIKWVLLGVLILSCGFANAASKEVIDAKVREALAIFAKESPAGIELMEKAAGVLVFPDVIKIGFGLGGEYGEGSLLIDGEPQAYYSTAAGSFGFQLGAQFKTELILFMTDASLERFRGSNGWEAGVDGSVALVTVGVGGAIDTKTMQKPIVGFVFSNRGLMYNLTLEGSKITKIDR
ncbi:MAG: YSC84-related protein [Gammaproteobacteria bacterium]|nr:YSC84-related protein [Gammaproteobacteria bacterium]